MGRAEHRPDHGLVADIVAALRDAVPAFGEGEPSGLSEAELARASEAVGRVIEDWLATLDGPRGAEEDRQREEQRAAFLRALLEGTLSPAETERRASAYGLLPGARYLTLRARRASDDALAALRRSVEASGANGTGVLVAAVDGELWGIAGRQPVIESGQGVVGLGPLADLSGAAASFALASRALDTAGIFGLDGAVSIDDVSLRAAIVAEDHLGERLVRRYLDPLGELGDFGAALERTVREYLAHGMRIDESARALIIHPNTLRHRLERFQQLTGADLRRTEDVVEVWWALERRRAVVGPSPPAEGSA